MVTVVWWCGKSIELLRALYVLSPLATERRKMMTLMFWLSVIFMWFTVVLGDVGRHLSFSELKADNGQNFESFFRVPPSVYKWGNIDGAKKFSILSMQIDHNTEAKWFMKHLHSRDSIGWNRTQLQRQFGAKPHACSIRFIGVGLEKTLNGYQYGGTGYMTIGFKDNYSRQYWHGFDKNETNRLHCYYSTTKETGSEFKVRKIDDFIILFVFIFAPFIESSEDIRSCCSLSS